MVEARGRLPVVDNSDDLVKAVVELDAAAHAVFTVEQAVVQLPADDHHAGVVFVVLAGPGLSVQERHIKHREKAVVGRPGGFIERGLIALWNHHRPRAVHVRLA